MKKDIQEAIKEHLAATEVAGAAEDAFWRAKRGGAPLSQIKDLCGIFCSAMERAGNSLIPLEREIEILPSKQFKGLDVGVGGSADSAIGMSFVDFLLEKRNLLDQVRKEGVKQRPDLIERLRQIKDELRRLKKRAQGF